MSKNAPNFLYERLGAQFLNCEIKKGQLLRKLVSYVREPTVYDTIDNHYKATS